MLRKNVLKHPYTEAYTHLMGSEVWYRFLVRSEKLVLNSMFNEPMIQSYNQQFFPDRRNLSGDQEMILNLIFL